jgi:hypothetical protein
MFLPLVFAATLTAFGDSITVGHCPPSNCGALDAAHGYAALVADGRGMTLSNLGSVGSQLEDAGQMDAIYARTFTDTTEEFMILTGFNDEWRWVGQPAGRQTYREALAAALAWLSVSHSSKVVAGGSSVTYSSGWSTSGAAHGSAYTDTHLASATFQVTGSVIYVVSEHQNVGDGIFLLSVDDEPIGTFACSGNPTTAAGRTYTPFLIRIAGLAATTHTVKITKTGGDRIYFTWAGAPVSGRPVYVGNCLRLTSGGYTSLGTTDLNVALYNRDIAAVTDMLAADGLPVHLVDASAAYDPNVDGSGDGAHPGNAGHLRIANAFLARMNGGKPTSTGKREVAVRP